MNQIITTATDKEREEGGGEADGPREPVPARQQLRHLADPRHRSSKGERHLEDNALAALGLPGPAGKSCACGVLEDFANTFAALGGAFEVVLSTDLLSYCHALFRCDRPLRGLP